MISDTFPTYALRGDDLAAYFRTQFPGYTEFNIQLSPDDSALYLFEIPKPLTQAQRRYIEEHVKQNRHVEYEYY